MPRFNLGPASLLWACLPTRKVTRQGWVICVCGGILLRNSHRKAREATGAQWKREGRRECLLGQLQGGSSRPKCLLLLAKFLRLQDDQEASLDAKMQQS